LLFINQGWLPGAIAAVGTLVNGIGARWVVDRRSDAVTEETQAYDDLKSVCGAGAASRTTAARTSPEEGVPQEVLDFQRKLRLFGWVR
jgi:hypothetical protein